MSKARPRFTAKELDALCSALSFITAGEFDEETHGQPIEIFCKAHEKVNIMQDQRAAAKRKK